MTGRHDFARRSRVGGKPLTLIVSRGGSQLDARPARSNEGRRASIDSGSSCGRRAVRAGCGPRSRFASPGGCRRDIVASLGHLVTGEGRKDISSPVGIVQGSSDAAKQGTGSFLWVLGLISLSIALLNLLPLLPLDGGHIVFAIIEGIRGRTVPREVYERVSIVGIGLVLLLFVIGLTNDIGRLS